MKKMDMLTMIFSGMLIGFTLTLVAQETRKRIQLSVCEETAAMHLPMKCKALYYELGYTN